MKILCLSDIHDQFGDYKPSELPDADIVLLAGDITDLGVRGEMRSSRKCATGIGSMGEAAAWLRQMGERYPGVFWIPGNHDIGVNSRTFEDIPNILCVLDKTVRVGPFSLTGVSLTPCFAQPSLKLAWDYMTDDPGIDRAAFDLPPVDIILSHGPPKGVLDGPSGWGSPGLLRYVREHQPRLVVCGHIHEDGGEQAKMDETQIINAACYPVLIDLLE
jgi:Icc-related predicted phosphoesterase